MKLEFPIYDLRCALLKKPAASVTPGPIANRRSKIAKGFTLIELLTVITIIAVLAAFLLTVTGGVEKEKYINTSRAEMARIETALERYKGQYGTYPPAGTNVLVNPLYTELVGTTNIAGAGNYVTLDGGEQALNPASYGVSGFVNCSKPGAGGEDSPAATDFLTDLKPNQVDVYTNTSTGFTNAILITSSGGPETAYQPIGMQGVNPWRYVYPGTNNPNSYDLWVQLVIGKTTNLVCNWSGKVQVNTPYQ